MIKKFNEYINEELDAVTVGLVGNGTAVTGYPTGSWATSAGQAVYGGDSGSAFADNSSGAKGLEQEIVCPPKNIFREPKGKKTRKNKKERTYNKIGKTIDQLHRPTMKVNEAQVKEVQTFICRVENREEVFAIINKLKNTFQNMDVNYNEALNRLTVFPNWLFIDLDYVQSEIYVNYWGDNPDYNYNLRQVTNRLDNGYCTDRHMHIYSELSDIITKTKKYFDIPIAPNYSPRKTTRTLDEGVLNEGKLKRPYTFVCQVQSFTEAQLIINKFREELPEIKIGTYYMGHVRNFPNWLYIDSYHNETQIQIEPFGDYINYDNTLRIVSNDIRRCADADPHLYNYDELSLLTKKIKEYFDIPIAPNYSPKKTIRTLDENIITNFNLYEGIKNKMTPIPMEQIERTLSNMSQREKNMKLMNAIQEDDTVLANMLIDRGANPNVIYGHSWSALMWAIQRGQTEVVQKLIDNGADIEHIGNGMTPLTLAEAWERNDIIELLKKHGAKQK